MVTLVEYTDLDTMKQYVGDGLPGLVVTEDDSLLIEAISSASREVDRRCGRYFGKDTVISERTFECYGSGLLIVDDIWTTEGLLLDGEALTSDYKLLPRNGVLNGQPGNPYTHIKSDYFYKGEEYAVTAKWGWEDVPPVVREFTKMIAAETYFAKDTPLGVKGENQFGAIRVRERFHIEKKIALYSRDRVKLI